MDWFTARRKTWVPTEECEFLDLWRQLSWSGLSKSEREKTSPQAMKLPIEALDWTKWIEINEAEYIGGGTYGDAYKGRWRNLPKNFYRFAPEIVVKVMRLGPLSDRDSKKRYKLVQREIIVWNSVKHENIVPFVGVCYPRGPECPVLISPWMKNRDITFFLKENPRISRRNMLLGIAQGLEFLHNHNPKIAHGDVKGANILINKGLQPCLIDFGVSSIMSDEALWHTSSTKPRGSVRWQAPELMAGSFSTVTIEGDVYSFAMTCLEVMTGDVPYRECKSDFVVPTLVLVEDKIPEKPPQFNDHPYLWDMLLRCWSREASQRPPIASLVTELLVTDFMERLSMDLAISLAQFNIISLDLGYSTNNTRGIAIVSCLKTDDRDMALEILLLDRDKAISDKVKNAWKVIPRFTLINLIFNRCEQPKCIRTRFMDAAERGSLDKVVSIVNSIDTDNNAYLNDYEAALILSASKGHHEVTRFLLDHSHSDNVLNWPLVLATRFASIKWRQQVLELFFKSASFNHIEEWFASPGNLRVAKVLLAVNANVTCTFAQFVDGFGFEGDTITLVGSTSSLSQSTHRTERTLLADIPTGSNPSLVAASVRSGAAKSAFSLDKFHTSSATLSTLAEPSASSQPKNAGDKSNHLCQSRALYSYTADPDDPNELSFKKGEILDILDKRGLWWQARRLDGTTGIAPSNYLQHDDSIPVAEFRKPYVSAASPEDPNEVSLVKGKIPTIHDDYIPVAEVRALYTYTASPEDPNQISFDQGEILSILDSSGKWWQARKNDGTTGIVPSNYLLTNGLKVLCRARALNTHFASPNQPTHISFTKGEILEILNRSGKWWKARKKDGTTGLASSDCLVVV